MDLSYTQNLEDYHLALAFAGQPTGTYIDIGAGHPIADNVSFWFYERGWRGVVVEPQGDLAALYARLRPRDIAERALIGRAIGEADFFLVDRLHGFSSMLEASARQALVHGASYRKMRLPAMTLAALCERHQLREVDFLKIDVEGGEADVLAGADFTRFRPKVIVAEAVAPGSNAPAWAEWEPLLLKAGYRFRLFDTLNRFYVAEECPDIFARLPAERADWHAVQHMYEIGRAPENALHPDHKLANELARGFWASLPWLAPEMIAALLARARRLDDAGAIAALKAAAESEPFLASLGRIACGYDGGQVVSD